MNTDDFSYEARSCVQRLARFDVALPGDAARWHTRLLELMASTPQAPEPNVVAELIVDGASETAVNKAIAAHLAQHHRTQQHHHAEQIAGRRVLAAVMADRDRLHTELAATAAELINRLHAAAALDDDVAALARAGRHNDASLLANAPADAQTLSDLFQFRDWYLTPSWEHWSTGWWSCENFENPWDARHIGTVTGGDVGLWPNWRAAIRAGARLWFVPVEQAVAASQTHEPNAVKPIDPRRSTATFAR
jgi:hypothetical protein